MSFSIEIVEGHVPSSYFWIYPVILHKEHDIEGENVEKLPEEISIEEENVRCFLAYFFYKFFDEGLNINRERIIYEEDGHSHIEGFEWYLEHNFFTYDTIRLMLADIDKISRLLKDDYENVHLRPIIDKYSIYYMTECDSNDYHIEKDNQADAIKKNIHVVLDFYRRFINRINKMMEHNQSTNIICIMGP